MIAWGLVTTITSWCAKKLSWWVNVDDIFENVHVDVFSFFCNANKEEYHALKLLCALPIVRRIHLNCIHTQWIPHTFGSFRLNDIVKDHMVERIFEWIHSHKFVLCL